MSLIKWWAIRARSASLSPQDRNRLQWILAFLDDELQDAPNFSDVNLAAYQREPSLRRNPATLDSTIITTHNYGMASAKYRTSFALDEETIRLIQQLASQWSVSQAEVVRRAVRMTADGERSNVYQLRERLRDYQEAGRMTAETAARYLDEVSADRAGWERGGWTRGGAS